MVWLSSLGFLSLSLIVTVPAWVVYLTTNFTCWEKRGVYVHVCRIRAHRLNSLRELTRGNTLACGPNDVGWRDRTGYRASPQRTRRLATSAAQKEHDPTGLVNGAEMHMREQRIGLKVLKHQFEIEGTAILTEPCSELSDCCRRNGVRRLLKSGQLRSKRFSFVIGFARDYEHENHPECRSEKQY